MFFIQDYSKTLKRDLSYLSQKWQEQIDRLDLIQGDRSECRRMKYLYDKDINDHRDRLEVAVIDSSESEENKQEFKLLIEELEQIQVEFNVNFENFRDYVERRYDEMSRMFRGISDEKQRGLTAQRIQQFEHFQADMSFLDDQCVICMGDIEIGRNMMRLDCDGQHTFCQVCIEEWFAIKKTCPICRHVFQ